MKIVNIKAYEFNELDEKGKSRVKDWLDPCFEMDEDTDSLKKEFLSCVNEPVISWTGFWSQGDGASFTGTLNDDKVVEFIRNDKSLVILNKIVERGGDVGLSVSFDRTTHQYSHEMTCTTNVHDISERSDDWSDDAYNEFYKEIEGLEKDIEGWRLSACFKIYRSLEESYEHYRSDEYIQELCDANEYMFNVRGECIDSMIVA